ncbi:MAG TPA: mandelate racemase/muconate lactonizing enzyme family protein [Terracidiphilus sp.]|jgi:L-alanine-DL-glutamate epimerase-like enolase superfamily enzyme|nr:mandelate racemase/muconate lactonizing enzyme family protein [Terracidiphilus sp.]
MKISDVNVMVLESPSAYQATAGGEEAHGIKYLGIVKVETDVGIVGYADLETQPHVAQAIVDAPSEGSVMGFKGLRSLLIGEDPFDVERLWHKMYMGSVYYGRRGAAMQVISGIDIALWDIVGKKIGEPVYKLLGGAYRDQVRPYASTLFRSTSEGMAEASRAYLEQGFTAVKFGWGVFGEDAQRDVELVAAARKALGERADLLIDTGWYIQRTAKEAIQMVRRLEPFRPFLIEEPLSPEDYDGYAELSGAVDTLIACGEQEATEWGFHTLIERGHVDVVQPDLSRCGGFTAARKIVHLAELYNRLCIPHAWTSDLLTAASLHLNAFMRRSVFQEFNVTVGPLSRELCLNPVHLEDGMLRVPQGPGLGVEVDESVITKYRVG